MEVQRAHLERLSNWQGDASRFARAVPAGFAVEKAISHQSGKLNTPSAWGSRRRWSYNPRTDPMVLVKGQFMLKGDWQ